MTTFIKSIFSFLAISVLLVIFTFSGLSGEPNNNNETQKENLIPVSDPASMYKQVCGQCHLPYPPAFLPSGSWKKILGAKEEHFGNPLDIDQKTIDIISGYLNKNGAEHSEMKESRKIMQSLNGETPLRLTEVPYLLKKHRKISPEVYQRNSIGSFSNCNACHRSADQWIFSKKIVIPK